MSEMVQGPHRRAIGIGYHNSGIEHFPLSLRSPDAVTVIFPAPIYGGEIFPYSVRVAGHEVFSNRIFFIIIIPHQTHPFCPRCEYPEDVFALYKTIRELAPGAVIIEAASPQFIKGDITGKDVLVVEDGPTLTHGGMPFGAGTMAAEKMGANLVDPYPFAVGSIKETFDTFEHIGPVLPAMGYGEEQVKELETTINAVDCDAVVVGTPIDLTRIIQVNKPAYRVKYELQEIGNPTLEDVLKKFL